MIFFPGQYPRTYPHPLWELILHPDRSIKESPMKYELVNYIAMG